MLPIRIKNTNRTDLEIIKEIVEKYDGLYTSKHDGSIYSLDYRYYPAAMSLGLKEDCELNMVLHDDDGRPYKEIPFRIRKRDQNFVYFR